jgi:hypothetical protein
MASRTPVSEPRSTIQQPAYEQLLKRVTEKTEDTVGLPPLRDAHTSQST